MKGDDYWHTQTPEKPAFPDSAWSQPEQKSKRGKLGIVGGNSLGFAGVAEAYSQATQTGTGELRALLPDSLKKTIPTAMTEVIFGESNPSGGLGKSAKAELDALESWADGILLIGDAGRNSETAILYEAFVSHATKPLIITRDAVDLLKHSTREVIERPQTTLVVSFAQLQKIFSAVYYPKVLTFSMQLAQLVDTLHKFTITYPVSIMVLHKDHMVVASGGEVVTQPWENTMAVWRGTLAAQVATALLWDPSRPLEQASHIIA